MDKKAEYRKAVMARFEHERECPHWDCAGNGGCEECDRHDEAVAKLRKQIDPAKFK